MPLFKLPGRVFLYLSVALLLGLALGKETLARENRLSSATDVMLSGQTVSGISAGRDIHLNAVEASGSLMAGGNITCTSCSVAGHLSAGRDVLLENCPEVQGLSNGRDAEITRSHILMNVTAGHDITLNEATIDQSVIAGNRVFAENATVKGFLTVGGNYVRLDRSHAQSIVFSQNTNLNSGIHFSGDNQSVVHVGPSSLSSVNGYTIQGAMNQTTVMTPEQDIYVNGKKVSGSGAASYGQYRAQHPEAPFVQGPGWEARLSEKGAAPADKKKNDTTPKEAVNVLELINQSVVDGTVRFEGDYGKILVHPGSRFSGTVVNGRVEKLPN